MHLGAGDLKAPSPLPAATAAAAAASSACCGGAAGCSLNRAPERRGSARLGRTTRRGGSAGACAAGFKRMAQGCLAIA